MTNGMKKILAVLTAVMMLCGMCLTASAEDVSDIISNAGTTQAFVSDAVSEEDLNTILEAGLSAASAINQQPWYFAVVTNQDVMNEIAASAENAYGETEMGEAPVAIIVYMDETTSSTNPSFDCGLACQNMVVAASAFGYGAKIVAYPTEALNGENHDAFCETLGVDASMKAVAVLMIGYEDTASAGTVSGETEIAIDEKVSFVD